MTDRRFALLVGSSIFPAEPLLEDLAFPENDVDGMEEILSSKTYGDFTEVYSLKNRPHHEVLRKINEVLKAANKDDFVLVYYSGHGKLDGAFRLHLATVDTELSALESTSVPTQSIVNYIEVSPSNKTALILDCCYAGAIGSVLSRSGLDDGLNLISGGRGTFVMTASTAIQVAKEKEGDRYGVFTKHLIEGIRSGQADRDGDGLITMNEIYNYVHDQVLNESHQEPMKWDLRGRGELIIARSPIVPREERRNQIRESLFDLARKGILPDSIVSMGLEIAAMKPQELTERHQEFDKLLDTLKLENFRAGDFVEAWLELEKTPLDEFGAGAGKPEKSVAMGMNLGRRGFLIGGVIGLSVSGIAGGAYYIWWPRPAKPIQKQSFRHKYRIKTPGHDSGFYIHIRSKVLHYVTRDRFIRHCDPDLLVSHLRWAGLATEKILESGGRQNLTYASVSTEEAALASVASEAYDEACLLLLMGIRDDWIFKRNVGRSPSVRLHDLLAAISVRRDRYWYLQEMIEFLQTSRQEKIFGGRIKKWSDPGSNWYRTWRDRSHRRRWRWSVGYGIYKEVWI